MDDQQRARELLCQFCDLDRSDYYDGLRVNAGEAVEAITVALRGAPEVTDAMVEAAHAAYWSHPDDRGEDRPCIRAALEAAFAAHPRESER